MRAGGYLPEDFENEEFEVWPDNWQAFCFFSRIGTRWQHGMNGRVGLDWPAIYPLMDRLKLEPEAWDELRDDLETMEAAALKAMHAKA